MKQLLLMKMFFFASAGAAASSEHFSAGISFAGPTEGPGAYLELPLAASGRVMAGTAGSFRLLDGINLFERDSVHAKYLAYVNAPAQPGTQPEWSIGIADVERRYDRTLSDANDFRARADAALVSIGVRSREPGSAWIWRVGFSSLIVLRETEPAPFDKSVVTRAHLSVALAF